LRKKKKMQKRNSVLIAGVISIIILTSIQIFIIKGIWNQKDELFALRYTLRSQEALNSITMRMSTDGFDTVRFLLGNYSEKANKELHSIKNQEELAARKKETLEYFEKAVNQEQDLSGMLSSYFTKRGWDKNFKVTIEILNLEMISNDTINIFQSEEFTNRRVAERGAKTASQEFSKGRILVNWFRMEDNNYRFLFGYYIDFSDKQKVILKESLATLALSMFSIIVVIIIFITAYRNLMEEKRLSNLKTDFINNMTHELKTPLSTITVAGKTLEMEQIRANDQKILETAKLIGKQSIHLNQLINMILEISMWERTQFELEKKTIDIKELLTDIIDSFKTGCGNGTTITQKYNFNEVIVNLDVVYFTTLINNLLSNAVKYCDKDPVIDIEGFISENKICIKVTDNGIGINKVDQKHIFDKFYRASTGNIHKFKGLGLGLYYVKRIVEAHGGDVSVSSKQGKGSIFTVSIPYNL
jgi:signal transduction histidine kinase